MTFGCIQPLDHPGASIPIHSNTLQDVQFLEEQSVADIMVRNKDGIKLKFSADDMQS